MIKEIENNGIERIEIDTSSDRYILSILNEESKEWERYGTYDKYDNVQKALDRRSIQKKKKIPPMFALKSNHLGKPNEIKITSVAEDTGYCYNKRNYVWISYVNNKRREKVNIYGLFENSQHNKNVFESIKGHEKRITELRNSLIYLNKKDIHKHFGVEVEK